MAVNLQTSSQYSLYLPVGQKQYVKEDNPSSFVRLAQHTPSMYILHPHRLACAHHVLKGNQKGYTIKSTYDRDNFNYTHVNIIKNLNLHKRQKWKAKYNFSQVLPYSVW